MSVGILGTIDTIEKSHLITIIIISQNLLFIDLGILLLNSYIKYRKYAHVKKLFRFWGWKDVCSNSNLPFEMGGIHTLVPPMLSFEINQLSSEKLLIVQRGG